jgi:hypothetical protein
MMSNQELITNELIPDLEQANRFISKIMCFKQTCFQTFASREGDRIFPAHQHGSLKELSDWLTTQNQTGGGVYFVVNETNGLGRTNKDITRVRAVSVDLDGAPVEPVMEAKLKPHAIIESSPGRFQAFWRCKRIRLDEYTPIQEALIKKFGADPACKDLGRVMRLPGFWHLKKEPFMSRIVEENIALPYNKDSIINGLELDVNWEEETFNFDTVDDGIRFDQGQRNRSLVTVAARLRNSSLSGEDLLEALMKVNLNKCVPPLTKADVAKIAKWASKKEIKEITPARYNEFETKTLVTMPPESIEFNPPVTSETGVITRTATTSNSDEPKLRDWHTLATAQLPPARWVVQGILPQGLILFIGQAKTGKSWLCQSLALQIANGEPVLGHWPSNKGEVCVLALEDTHQRFQARMMKLIGGDVRCAPKNATYAIRWPRLPDCIQPIERWAESCENPRLLIIDVLNKMRPRPTRNDSFSDAYQRDYAFMSHFHSLAHKYKIAIVMIHHEKKGDKDDDYNRASGSAALGAAADGLWILNHSERGNNRGTLVVSGRDFESDEFTLEFDKESGHWGYIGSEKEVAKSEIQARILAAMKAIGKPATPTEISVAGELNLNSTKSGLFRLQEKGFVMKSVTHGHKYVISNSSFLGDVM